MTGKSLVVALLVVWGVGCGSSAGQGPIGTGGGAATGGSEASGTGGASTDGTGGSPGTGGTASVNPLGRARCTPPDGMTGSPQTIEDAVALVNALPKPTSVACFVESLDRPLGVYASNSIFSLQPAVSNASPRVFLKIGQMWVSVVIDGAGRDLIEFGETSGAVPSSSSGELRSLKGELQLPLTDVVAPTAAFDRVVDGAGGTACGLCHRQEALDSVQGTSQIFSSVAFRPDPATRVRLASLRDQATGCDWQAQPDRCDLLSALLGGGDVVDAEFPSKMATFITSSIPGP